MQPGERVSEPRLFQTQRKGPAWGRRGCGQGPALSGPQAYVAFIGRPLSEGHILSV